MSYGIDQSILDTFKPKPIELPDPPYVAAFNELLELIEEFRASLGDEQELGAYVANVDRPFHVRMVERKGHLFVFKGVDDLEQEVVAIQHFTQLNMQMVKLKKLRTSNAVGFTARSSD